MRKLRKFTVCFSLFLSLAAFRLSAADFYWEEADVFVSGTGSFPVSAYSDDFSVIAWQEVTPNSDQRTAASGFINIFLAVKVPGAEWEHKGMAAGPYAYSGTQPSIISLVIDNRGRIMIAAAAGSQTDILISNDRGNSFTRQSINMGEANSVAPRIFVRADGGYLLFVTRSHFQSLSIYYSRSNDGINWSPFTFFTPENSMALNFLPAHAGAGRRDIVFYQSLSMGIESTAAFQLYFKTSEDGGNTWTEARRFTTFYDPVTQTQSSPNNFDNQRPHMTRYGNNLFLVWERHYTTQPPQIYSAVINANGNIIGSVERVNSEEAYCNNPIGFIYDNAPTVVWFDNRRGNDRIFLAQRGDFDWQNQQLSGVSLEDSFARPAVSLDGVYIFWQGTTRSVSRIYLLAPDRSAASPRITTGNFTAGIPSRSERVRVSWNIPADTSGIFGFSWVWSRNETAVPPRQVMIYNIGNTENLNLELNADEDGLWYFIVSAQDFAGNWSMPSRIMYYRKTTPPPQVVIIEPELDDNGYLLSNTFDIEWVPSSDMYTAGYTWNLQYLGEDENADADAPPSMIMGTANMANFINQDNGIWVFSVSAVDAAGNIGEPSNIIFKTNKFIPYTGVSVVDAMQDEQGIFTVNLIGRGFETDGRITSIVLTREGAQDLAGEFIIRSDREIGGLRFDNLDEGQYNLRLYHSTRGWYTAPQTISIARTGTVKFGDYTNTWKPTWTILPRRVTFNPITALAVILIIFCLLGIIAAIRGIGGVIAEGAAVKQEALAIITGDFMPMEKKQKIVRVQKRGLSLRLKLAGFTTALVLLVVIMISTPVYIRISQTQRQTVLQGLYDRSKLLLEGIASSARAQMPRGSDGMLELGFLPNQSEAMPEANYVTITGYGSGSIYNDHVMATNDPDILSKIDTTEYRPGVSRITDALSPLYEQFSEELNNQARERVSDLSRSIIELNQEGTSLALRTDAEGIRRLNDIQVTVSSLQVRLTEILSEISGNKIGSYPQFSVEGGLRGKEREYIFFEPIMFRQGAEDNYFRGLVRLGVSLDSIFEMIYREQRGLLYIIVIWALIALAIGVAGALILSALIIGPIRKLVRHIEIIRDTEDKTKLAGVDIKIATRDEIAILGSTINDMTHGIVKAALAASDLSIGKEIQKKFIPLELDSHGNKQTSGFKQTPNLNFFGYYEGAKGVSGDYFDYRDLDGRYYAIIKCDVAGKGIPAALIMIQVATMFLNYFKQWKPNEKGMHIEEVVYQINEFIETLAFKGRFAAFTLCLFDSATGVVRFCNAGDNIIHLYDASECKVKTITLPQTPATGVLPNFMIESTGGYKVNIVNIDHGDILLLYTDGIEEAKRKFRNNAFKEITCAEGPSDTPHENHLCGQADEEMTPERVEGIINAVMAREVYKLHKYHNPEDSGDLQFDFTSCEGRVEDVIMALVSAEKMFRCYKNPNVGEDSRVLVDKKVDEFLKNHFLQYRRYCSHTREFPENPAYMYYTHVNEDEQYDDLTILGIKRK